MDSTQLLTYLTACVIVMFLYWLQKMQSKLPPGPWNLPIVGYLPWINPKAPYLTLTKLSQKFGPLYGLYFGNIYTVVVTDVNLMKKILMKDEASTRPFLYLFYCVSKFQGLIMANVELNKNQRKFLQNFLNTIGASRFSQNRSTFQNQITNQALDFVQFVQCQGEQIVIHPTEVLFHDVASVISRIILDTSWSRDDKNWNTLQHCLDEIPRIASCAGPVNFLPLLRFLPWFKKDVKALKVSVDTLLTNFKALIEKKKESFQDGDSTMNLIDAFLAERSRCKGDSKKFYSDMQLGYLINDLFLAGIETTLASLSWYILYMAVYQDVQNKVHRELMDVLDEEVPSLDHLSRLPYLEATLLEVARIRTLVPMGAPHYATQDITVDQYNIPKGTVILALTWAVHMDASVWKDPETFRPERFFNVDGKIFKPEYLVPFLVGKRMCPGEDLARIVQFTFVANIFRSFKIECEDMVAVDLMGDYGATLRPKPHKIKFTKL